MTALATGFVEKQSGEEKLLSLDVSAGLADGVTVSGTPTVEVESIESGSGATSDLSFDSITVSDTTISFLASGGTHGTIYRMLVTYETSDSQTLEVDCLLFVNDGTPALASAIAAKSLPSYTQTYYDMLEYLQNVSGSGGQSRSFPDYKQAIISAYDELRIQAKWEHYWTEYRIWLESQFTTGTVSYDHTGHAQGERAITFSSTPPSWIVGGRLRVGDRVYSVQQATANSDVFLLDPNVAPSADFAATGFTAYRSHYPLPDDMLTVDEIFLEDGPWYTRYIPPRDWMHHERRSLSSGTPWAWTVLPDQFRHGAYALVVFPPPVTGEPISFYYRRNVRPLRWSGMETASKAGTASGSATARVVSLTGGSADASMIGSVLRLSLSTTALPSSLAGDNPYVEQHLITGVSGNNLTLATPLANTYSSVKYRISDLIDISPTMTEALRAGVRWKCRQITGAKMSGSESEWYRLIRLAMANDAQVQRVPASAMPLSWDYGTVRFGVNEETG